MTPDYSCTLKHISFYGKTPAECLLKASKWFSEHINPNVNDGSFMGSDDYMCSLESLEECYDDFVFNIAFQVGLDEC